MSAVINSAMAIDLLGFAEKYESLRLSLCSQSESRP